MRASSFAGQVIAAISRRTPFFQSGATENYNRLRLRLFVAFLIRGHPVWAFAQITPEWSENWRAFPHCNGQGQCWMHITRSAPWCNCSCRWCRIARQWRSLPNSYKKRSS